MDATFQGGSNDTIGTWTAGDITNLSPSTFSYPWQLLSSMASLFLSPAIISNCSPDWSPVSTTPVRNLSPVSTTPVITENPWQRLIASINDAGYKFIAGVIDTGEQLIAGVVDTDDKHSFANISMNFWKIRNGPNGILGGLGDIDSWKKPEVQNFVSDSL
jgi:hypothetical protein